MPFPVMTHHVMAAHLRHEPAEAVVVLVGLAVREFGRIDASATRVAGREFCQCPTTKGRQMVRRSSLTARLGGGGPPCRTSIREIGRPLNERSRRDLQARRLLWRANGAPWRRWLDSGSYATCGRLVLALGEHPCTAGATPRFAGSRRALNVGGATFCAPRPVLSCATWLLLHGRPWRK